VTLLQTEIKVIHLLHPIQRAPAEAQRIGYYTQAGRAVGYELQFPDGHRCNLTYAEIGKLIEADEAYGREEETAVLKVSTS